MFRPPGIISYTQYRGERERERTRASIRVQNGNAMLAGPMLEKPLLGAIVGRAGQTGQVNQQRHLGDGLIHGLWWQVQVKVHLAVGGLGRMAGLEQFASERGNRCFCCHGHFSSFFFPVVRGRW